MKRGSRDSEWYVVRRCLAVVRRLQRGAAGRDELIAAARAVDPPGEDDATDGARRRRFEEDLDRIRNRLGIDVHYDTGERRYALHGGELPLLDLPDEDLATLAWLEATFGAGTPNHERVHALLGRLRRDLGAARAAEMGRRPAPALDLGRRDGDEMAPGVEARLDKALREGRRVRFRYLSPQHGDGRPRLHVVDPYERTFDAAQGHDYLYGYCRRCEGPGGREEAGRFITYRVGRITEAEVLPEKMAPVSPAGESYEVVYELAPEVARTGVSRPRWIEVEEVEGRDDGGAVVRGRTGSLFWAVRALLHYGAACRVVGGEEMVREMRAVVAAMAGRYEGEGEIGLR